MITLGTKFQLDQCLLRKMFMVGGVQKIGSFSTMDEKLEKADIMRIAQ